MARILVIEDNPELRRQIAATLSHAGYEVDEVGSGRDALRTLVAGEHDVAVMDILMPELDGLELLSELRARRSPVAIVAVSGGGMLSGFTYLEMAKLLGAHATLQKPIVPTELLAIVSALVDGGPHRA